MREKTVAVRLVAIVLLGILSSVSDARAALTPEAAASTLSPDEIYARALGTMRGLQKTKPRFLVYRLDYAAHNLKFKPVRQTNGTVEWDADLVHANFAGSYQVWFRSKDERALTQDLATHATYVGEALFAPAPANVGERSGSAAGGSLSGDVGNVMAQITVTGSRDYSIRLVGVERVKGHDVYHLHLHAFRKPTDNPLTDLFVDTQTFRIWRAHGEAAWRAVVAGGNVAVDVDFDPFGAAWLVTGLRLHGAGYMALWHATFDTTLRSYDFTAPETLPEGYFAAPR